ncbi:hypothetical protein ACJMK2_004731 [Sinanodonta woodiana]|uniref:Uncharacterized protein n=1 Tax=Sinanodonta woodiana TaxID=1069815 RepID=A0ABD3VQX8_SINWO
MKISPSIPKIQASQQGYPPPWKSTRYFFSQHGLREATRTTDLYTAARSKVSVSPLQSLPTVARLTSSFFGWHGGTNGPIRMRFSQADAPRLDLPNGAWRVAVPSRVERKTAIQPSSRLPHP